MMAARKFSKLLPSTFKGKTLCRGSTQRIQSHPERRFSMEIKQKRISLLDLENKYQKKKSITMITAYDYPSASLIDETDLDTILVGDSQGMVVSGYDSTVPVTMEETIHHCKAVARGSKTKFLVGDMPFGSYEISPEQATSNAIRIMKEGNMNAVKLEGGVDMVPTIKAIVRSGIPVVGHIGLTPQSVSKLGGFKVQGKTAESADGILEDALALQEAGCTALVIESVPARVAEFITTKLDIPTIGIGAGVYTSGQVLVWHDILGLYSDFSPKFSKRYAECGSTILAALNTYASEVEEKKFPGTKHSYTIKKDELQRAFSKHKHKSTEESSKAINSRATGTPIGSKGSDEVIPSPFASTTTPGAMNALPNLKKKKIAIIGGGAMGSFFGASLAQNPDLDVHIVSSWKENTDAINRAGLTFVKEDNSCSSIENLTAGNVVTDTLTESGHFDIALVTVKGPSTEKAGLVAKQILHPDNGVALTLQNGLGNKKILEDILGTRKVIQGVTNQAATMIEAGRVAHRGVGLTSFAAHNTGNNIVDVQTIADIFQTCGLESTIVSELESMLWGKLLINAAINPITALFRVKNGVLAENEQCKDLMKQTIRETCNVAEVRGIPLGLTEPDAFAAVLDVAKATSPNTSSMLYDVYRGVPTEINSINGVIVKEGALGGVDVTFNKMLVDSIQKQTLSH